MKKQLFLFLLLSLVGGMQSYCVTDLHLALEDPSCDIRVIETILKRCVPSIILIKDENGKTALDIAKDNWQNNNGDKYHLRYKRGKVRDYLMDPTKKEEQANIVKLLEEAMQDKN